MLSSRASCIIHTKQWCRHRYLLQSPSPISFRRKHTFNCVARPTPASSMMSSSTAGEPKQQFNPASNPKVVKLRQLIGADPSDGWEKSWSEGVTPWDLGQPTPVVVHLVETGALPKGRVLVPGCGTGHDVVALASPERYVVGLDVSETCIKKAKERFSSLPNTNQFTFLAADFFLWQPTELFDLIFDYTFFCAIEPGMRPAWAEKVRDILKPEGELITLMYLINDQDEGPPFNNAVADYDEVLNPVGFKAVSIEDNELAVGPRKGQEKIGRWKLDLKQSFL